MQWIIEHQALLIAAISGALVSGGVVGWFLGWFGSLMARGRINALFAEHRTFFRPRVPKIGSFLFPHESGRGAPLGCLGLGCVLFV